MEESGFVRAIQAEPNNDTARLVYADWLEERGEPTATAKSEFLRATVALNEPGVRKVQRQQLEQRLQQLAADLDTAWLGVVSYLRIENCQGKQAEARSRRSMLITFNYLCDRRWQDMQPTEQPAVRYCDSCRQSVHYCDTIMAARQHAGEGHCIAVDLGVIRRKDDLEPPHMWLGRPSEETVRQERERSEPDAVSAKRERQKRAGRWTRRRRKSAVNPDQAADELGD